MEISIFVILVIVFAYVAFKQLVSGRAKSKSSNGRIHSAFVSAISIEQRSATVEWFEHGETKGKEIDLGTIGALNPDLIIPGDPTPQIETTEPKRQDSLVSSDEEETSAAMAHSGHYSSKLDESDDDLNSNQQQLSPDTMTLSIQKSATNATILNKPTNGSVRSSRLVSRPTQLHTAHDPTPQGRQTIYHNNENDLPKEKEKENVSNLPTTRQTLLVQNARRGNVVKEVEKLKKNREERRQRQAEEKAEKEAFLQMAPGNPHWELLNMIHEFRRGLDMRPLNKSDAVEDHLITVCVRKRPLNRKEQTKKEVDVITIPSKNQLIVHEPKNKVDLTKYLENQMFRFDYAFDENCSNEMVYIYTAQPLVKTIFDGGFATCFAYGQTGSGKTHTMGGDFNGKDQDCQKGIYAMAAADVFRLADSSKYRHLFPIISVSFFEIYSGKVFDLLNNKTKLRVLEDGKQVVQVVGLTEKKVEHVEEVLTFLQKGNQARTSGQTSANSNSSRSHAIFQILLRVNGSMKVYGKFSLIDLAGNERGADTSSANRQTRMEGAEINKSLLALKECIRALGRKGTHLPFRVSKLTQVLRDSFVGNNSRTCMIAMISPGVSSCEHSLNTLRYANRVKELGAGDLQSNQGDEDYDNEKPDDGDLLQLRSLNEQDMTPELLNFHQVISELEIAEENVLENHKKTVEYLKTAASKAETILQISYNVTYDQEVYCNAWKSFLDQTASVIKKARESVEHYSAKLVDEERLSRKTKRH